MDTIVTQMLILFVLVIVGYCLSKKGLMDEEFDRKLSGLVINVTCPCLILSSVMGDTLPDKRYILPLLAVGFATYVILIGAAFLLPRYLRVKPTDRGIYSFMLAFGNVGFIGYPIVASIFGSSAVFYACILNFPSTLLIFVFGTLFISGGQGKMHFDRRTLYCPAMIASYLFDFDCADGLDSSACCGHVFCLVGECDGSCRVADYRFLDSPGSCPPHVRQSFHLYDVGTALVADSVADFIPFASLSGGRDHCQYQCGAGSHAGSFVWHAVLHSV